MERRKVIQQGKGTLTMSLPMKWVKQTGIKAGDEIFLEQKGITLKISPTVQKIQKRTEVNVSGFNKSLLCIVLHNLYVRGDDEVLFRFDTPALYEVVREGVRGLLGFEIIEHTTNTCTIKELAKGEESDFDPLLRRILLILLSMAEDGSAALQTKDKEALKNIDTRDKSINVLVRYCLRMLNKQTCRNFQKAMHMYALLTLLEHLGDEYSRFYRSVSSVHPNTMLLTKHVVHLLRAFYELFYKFSKEGAVSLLEERNELRIALDMAIETKQDIIALHYLRRITDLIVDIEKFHLAMQL